MWQTTYHYCAKKGMDRLLGFFCRYYRGYIDMKDISGKTAACWAFELGEEKCFRVGVPHSDTNGRGCEAFLLGCRPARLFIEGPREVGEIEVERSARRCISDPDARVHLAAGREAKEEAVSGCIALRRTVLGPVSQRLH